jgi:hypothetical protein
MNLSPIRFLNGIIGGVIFGCLSYFYEGGIYFSHTNTIVIVFAISFFIFFLWGDHIFNSMSKSSEWSTSFKDMLSKKEKDDEKNDEGDHDPRFS